MNTSILKYFEQSKTKKDIEKVLKSDINKISLKASVGSSLALYSSLILQKTTHPNLFIFRDKEEASYFINDIENILKKEVFFFPASYRRAYQIEETDNANILLRSEVLNKLNSKRNPIIVTYSEALSEKVISRRELKKRTISIHENNNKNIEIFEEELISQDFELTNFVTDPGQYANRGGIIDVFSYANEYPFRIEFFEDKIESIRTFDINTQLSISIKNKIVIVPNTEAKKISKKQVSLIEYLPKNAIVWIKDVSFTKAILNEYYQKSVKHFNELKNTQHIHPENLFTDGGSFIKKINGHKIIELGKPFFKPQKTIQLNCSPLITFNKNIDLLIERLRENTLNNIKNLILCSSKEQENRFHNIFEDKFDISQVDLIQISIHEGFADHNNQIEIFTDHQIFNRHHKFKSKTKFSDKQIITLKQLTNLKLGDYVTHIDHGIGLFSGLHKIENNSKKQEVIKLTYKGGDILYISIHALHKISKYSGKEGGVPKINQLGTPSWNKSKQKTKNKIKQIAFDLITLYAKRKKIKGFSFSPDTYLQFELESSFIYEDTPDQNKATIAIKSDMENEMPMDRLVCGDVGFGKTEVAIRAAFKAVADNKQVAILVPTTILALQHFKTFSKRLKNLPCRIDYLNRFRTMKEQKEIIKNLENGKIDIIIGTHKIVGKDIFFKDLGLLIIDEEQKFGVNIKDKLKSFKSNIDTLTLTATPIPRTLQFSLLGARDLSIINTPPPNRQSIETQIIGLNEVVIRDAIIYEISRNGQIFFVHNRIENIKEIAGFLSRLCPDAKIKIGHGQMEGNLIEELMSEFMEGDFDILVSTTIIENGVDIPNANTIIINNAQNFGLSDLHQMRGRVGRSNKKAFCYLISPPTHQISDDSRKRLNALEQFSNIGSGFKIAMRDLDIRGAGDLLGADQSGFINEIGFEMYQRILNEAIDELKEEKFQNLFKDEKQKFIVKDCQLDTDKEVLIPDNYVSSIEERLTLYKELNDIHDEENLLIFKKNLVDRFGKTPNKINILFEAIRLRWKGKEIGFERIVLKNDAIRAYFISNNQSKYFESRSFKKVLNYLRKNPKDCVLKEVKGKLSLSKQYIFQISDAINLFQNILNQNI
ncbi:MAG: transcription-repair coupling factor [Flavobacteriales bacterium]|nr:transcription-repair coupling factor [Flavobacteriales bacterium]